MRSRLGFGCYSPRSLHLLTCLMAYLVSDAVRLMACCYSGVVLLIMESLELCENGLFANDNDFFGQ